MKINDKNTQAENTILVYLTYILYYNYIYIEIILGNHNGRSVIHGLTAQRIAQLIRASIHNNVHLIPRLVNFYFLFSPVIHN